MQQRHLVPRHGGGALGGQRGRVDAERVVSAEAFFTLTDLCGLSPDEAIASAAHAAGTITTAAVDDWRAGP